MNSGPSEELGKVIEQGKKIIQENLNYGKLAEKKTEEFVAFILSRVPKEIINEVSETAFNVIDFTGGAKSFLLKLIFLRFGPDGIQFNPTSSQKNTNFIYVSYHIQSTKQIREIIQGERVLLQHESEGGNWVYQFPWPSAPEHEQEWWKKPDRFRVFDEGILDKILVETFKP